VLRLIKGDEFFVQTVRSDIRYKVALIEYGKDSMECNILDKQEKNGVPTTTTMLIAMPNKWEKVELIVQKLCEIGINNIIFRPAERSVIKTWNEKKEERLLKIAKEAVEQSRGWHLPVIESSNDISKHIQDTEVIIFDKIKDEELRSKDSKSKVQGLRSKV
jgi:RsmE family RNA methyltransferase